jgi:hypothetical protein
VSAKRGRGGAMVNRSPLEEVIELPHKRESSV